MLHTPKPTNIAELKTALLQYGMICRRSSLKRQPRDFRRDFDFVLLQLADALNTWFKYREGSWHSLLKCLKCCRKSCAKFDSLLHKTYWIFRPRLHVHLKKWTLKFKLLYLLNRICYFNKKAQLSLTNQRDAKACQNCSNSTCLQRCRWQYWPIFMHLTAIASKIREIPRNSLKIQTYGVQGHPRSSILVSIETPYVTLQIW